MLKKQYSSRKWIAGICATPAKVFMPAGLLNEVTEALCYPTFKDSLKGKFAENKRVVVSEKFKISNSVY